ncbi:MAG TPA: hypothetical protein PKN57_09325 [Saprospiraceae bacterium]|nr:hypothetical protein [Saprospiraceae bacterium]HNO38113.1 hypothetical protein [Saprospiraceae bacterium]
MKAIHNKDYSVVKTFGLLLVHNQGAFFFADLNFFPAILLLL